MTAHEDTVAALQVAANAANESLAKDIVAFDVSDSVGITDAFLIASGTNSRQVLAIAEEIEKQLYVQLYLKASAREGLEEATWVLLDYGDFVIHVMDEGARAFYSLETLWGDSPRIDLTFDKPVEEQ